MDKNIKERWIRDLRSGNYNQIQGELSNSIGFCCLGVLTYISNPEKENLPSHERYHKIYDVIGHDNARHLENMNDQQHKNFNKIADWIEANL